MVFIAGGNQMVEATVRNALRPATLGLRFRLQRGSGLPGMMSGLAWQMLNRERSQVISLRAFSLPHFGIGRDDADSEGEMILTLMLMQAASSTIPAQGLSPAMQCVLDRSQATYQQDQPAAVLSQAIAERCMEKEPFPDCKEGDVPASARGRYLMLCAGITRQQRAKQQQNYADAAYKMIVYLRQ